jgi:MYXO-CTERM domain-containing protein
MRIPFGIALCSVIAATQLHAAVTTFVYTDTVSDLASTLMSEDASTGIKGGDALKITLTLDNGNSSIISQTWDASDLISVTFDFGDGKLVTTFNNPFGSGLYEATGSISTNASGSITSFFSELSGYDIGTDYVSNRADVPKNWWINSYNNIYYLGSDDSIGLASPENDIDPAYWSIVASVPEASDTAAIAGLAVLGLAVLRRRK